MKNPILEEVWKAKEEVARECDYDLNRLFERLRRLQDEGSHKVVDRSERPKQKPAV